MASLAKNTQIIVIDLHTYWRELAANVLARHGFAVSALSEYVSPSTSIAMDSRPDLVVLGCSGIGVEERQLIITLLKNKVSIVVFCNSLSWLDTRALYSLGVKLVSDKPYDPINIIVVVEQVLESLAGRDSYQIVEQEV